VEKPAGESERGGQRQDAPPSPAEEREIVWAIARLQAGVLALVAALLGASGMFVMTAWLLVKGGPQVGPHLQLLAQYFYGYSVSWPGAFIGSFYGALVGGIVGWLIGALYNLIAGLRE
jgi:hypothetical protein